MQILKYAAQNSNCPDTSSQYSTNTNEKPQLKSISSAIFSRYLAHICIVLCLVGFSNPSYSITISQTVSRSHVADQAVAAKKAAAKKAAAKKTNSSKKSSTANKNGNAPPSTVNIDPLRDLGLNKGYVYFRVKAYSNIEISDFSKAICTYIKNSKKFNLAWASSSNSVIGYHIYFGTSAKITNNFIADVM